MNACNVVGVFLVELSLSPSGLQNRVVSCLFAAVVLVPLTATVGALVDAQPVRFIPRIIGR